jgi:hypothetical protein
MSAENPVTIERSKPEGPSNPLAHKGILDMVTDKMLPSQEIVPLVEYLRDIAGKPRGTKGQTEDLNSHMEELIIKTGEEIKLASLDELNQLLREQGFNVDILGVQSIGNSNQRVTAVVQGVDRNNPTSGYERPVVAEGPHMILAPYALDKKGELHLFRTIQMRTGEAVIDTPRGFADSKSLEGGQQMYEVENSGERVEANMKRVLGEEAGEALRIKRVVFLGAPRVNSSFVTSRSAMFAVEVDYDAFVKSKKVVTEAELQRRREQFKHEGIVGDVLDFPLGEYINYKKNPEISKDMAADFGTDTVVMDFLADRFAKQKRILSTVGQANRAFKTEDPEGYVNHMLRQSRVNKPNNYDMNVARAQEYLSNLYRGSLKHPNHFLDQKNPQG